MLGEAVRWGVVATNPAAAIRHPRAPRPALHVPNAETCTAILDRARGRGIEGPVVLALGTRMRLGEILAVRWKDVDLERKVVRVTATLSYVGGEFSFPQPKTSRARRSVDLPEFVVVFLRRQRKAQLERRLFYGETWTDYDVVLDDLAGAPFAPWSVSADFRPLRSWTCRAPGSTTCDTRMPHNCWPRASTRRPSANDSGIRPLRSRWTSTRR